METKQLSNFLSDTINNLLHTGKIEFNADELNRSIHSLESGETKKIFLSITELLTKLHENQNYIDDIANGKLDTEVPTNNTLAAPFKQLHANLSHLVWQVERLSEGDLNQRVDFLGNFSIYFNKLVESLKEKKLIEYELKSSKQKYHISIENANIGIMTVDIDSYILTTNKECANILGYAQSELEHMSVNDITAPEDLSVSPSFINSAITNKNKSKAEFIKRYFHKSGKIVTCQISSSLMYDENEQPLFFISHIKDITNQIEQEKVLKELNTKLSETVNDLKIANAAKDKFFRIIAHDLKNPFHSILGLSELLLDNTQTSNPEQINHIASIINQSTEDAYKLLENLLEWSMSQTNCIPFHPKKIGVQKILNEAIKLSLGSAKAKSISITYDINEKTIIYADANMLSTILRNLVSNAIKFTRKMGKIKVTISQNKNHTLFTVSDTGIGISPEVKDKLFKIEEKISIPDTDAHTGTGLGLLLCKEFVDKHDGKIWVESELGKGSDFKFTISNEIHTP